MSCGNTAGTLVCFIIVTRTHYFASFLVSSVFLNSCFWKTLLKHVWPICCFTSSLSSVYLSHCQEQCSQEQGKCSILRCLKSYCVTKQSLVRKKMFRASILSLLWEMFESSWRKKQGLHQVTAFFLNLFMKAPKECSHTASKCWQRAAIYVVKSKHHHKCGYQVLTLCSCLHSRTIKSMRSVCTNSLECE